MVAGILLFVKPVKEEIHRNRMCSQTSRIELEK
jgi:hypothetical protein